MTATPARLAVWLGGTVVLAVVAVVVFQVALREPEDGALALWVSMIPGLLWLPTVNALYRRWLRVDREAVD